MLSLSKEKAAELANDSEHLYRLMVLWPENHIIHQLAKSLDQLLAQPPIEHSVIDEQEAFERWLASDYSPDSSPEANDESESAMRAIFWHVWQARAQLEMPKAK
ncbi:TPA: hypothetical protein ACUM5U_002033 [Yersinia enterocolitica]